MGTLVWKNLWKNIIMVRFCCQCPAVKLMNSSPSTEAVKMRLCFSCGKLWKKLPCMRFDNQRWRLCLCVDGAKKQKAANGKQRAEKFSMFCGVWGCGGPTIVMHVNNKMNKSTFYGLLTSDINHRGCFFRPLYSDHPLFPVCL